MAKFDFRQQPKNETEALSIAMIDDPSDLLLWAALADEHEAQGRDMDAQAIRWILNLTQWPDDDVRAKLEPEMQKYYNEVPKEEMVEPVVYRNFLGMEFVPVCRGGFYMGSPPDEKDRHENEVQHPVELTEGFLAGRFEVTQEEYEKVMGVNPSHFTTPDPEDGETDTKRRPVESVSWHDATNFCKKLTEMSAEAGENLVYSLPTEAQWEYMARAGTQTPFHYGNSLSSHQANFYGDHPYGDAPVGPYLARTCYVGRYRPNGFGLYDCHGNVWEWCQDYFDRDEYARRVAQLKKMEEDDRKKAEEAAKAEANGGILLSEGKKSRKKAST